MLSPKKVKFRRWQVGRSSATKMKNKVAQRGNKISFGEYGMKALDPVRLRDNQIEAARRVLSRTLGKTGLIWIRIFPDRPWTQKAEQVPMGKGKGAPQGFEVQVLPGSVIFELANVSEEAAKSAITKAGKKLPIRVKFYKK